MRLIPTGEQSGFDAHRGDGKRFVVHADEKLTAFVELQAAIHRRFDAWLHVLLSNQIKIGHATAWMRTRVCASFMLRPYARRQCWRITALLLRLFLAPASGVLAGGSATRRRETQP